MVDDKNREDPGQQGEGPTPNEPPEQGGKRPTEPPTGPPTEPPPGAPPEEGEPGPSPESPPDPPPESGGMGAPPTGEPGQGQTSGGPPPPPPPGGGHGQPFASTGSGGEGTVPSQESRLWATVCHVSALAGLIPIPFLNLIAPLIVWLIKRQEDPFVDEQGKEAVNFQITVTIVGLALFVLSFLGPLVCITIPLGMALFVFAVVFVVMAAIKANDGQHYRYPWSLRLVA